MNRIAKTAIGVTVAALGVLTTTSASAATSTPGNITVLPGTTRVVNVPGRAIASGATTTVQITGTGAGQAASGATGVVVKVTAYQPSGTGSLVVHAAGTGAPGTPTVSFVKGSENSATAFVALNAAGQLAVTDVGAATKMLLEVDGQITPAAAPVVPAAATFGVGQFQVDGVTWASYSAAELGSPVGDMASGTVRFTCKLAAGCDVSLKAYPTATGETIYPRIVLEKEDNTTGGKLTCEYADGADNDGAVFALTGTATTVPLGIGSTADCGGSQTTVTGPVTSINVPGSAGQGIHYDAFVTLTFTKAAA